MSRPFVPQIVSANHLLEGDVVYLTAEGGWTRDLSDAVVARDAEAAAALLARAVPQQSVVVDPYLAEVALDGRVPRPLHYREVFRTRGPSNRPDLGRQAE
ncbi:MAG: DUF2849 domain-containing protein [Rubrimonas sp.]